MGWLGNATRAMHRAHGFPRRPSGRRGVGPVYPLPFTVPPQRITDQAFLQFSHSLEDQAQAIAFALPAGSSGDLPADSPLRQRFPEVSFEARGASGERLRSDPALSMRLQQAYRPEPIIPPGAPGLTLLVPPGVSAILPRILRGYWRYGLTLPPTAGMVWRQITVIKPAGGELQQLYNLMRPSLQLLGLLLIAAALTSEGLSMAMSSELNRILGPVWGSPDGEGPGQTPGRMPELHRSAIRELNRLVARINAQGRRVNALSNQLRHSEQQHRLLADNALDVITITDPSGRPTYISPSIEKVRGWTVEEAMALPMDRHLTREGCATVINALQQTEEAIRQGLPLPSFRVQLEQSHRDGSWIWTDVTSSCMVDERGTYIGTLLVYRDISETKRYEQRLQHLAYRDDLTGLPNRAASLEHLHRRLAEADQPHEVEAAGALVVVNLDFDSFQAVNDRFGRAVGNRVLITAAAVLRQWLQPEDWLARLESDEFLVIRSLPAADRDAARRFGQELQQALVAGLDARDDLPIQPSTSAGLALGPGHGGEPVALLQQLGAAGFRIVIDDFGTGYSSLVNLHTLPVHMLKIDKSFVQRVTEAGSERALIDSTLVIARKLGLETMAEGVETEAQWQALQELGCDSFQGYLFGQPMPAAALAGLL